VTPLYLVRSSMISGNFQFGTGCQLCAGGLLVLAKIACIARRSTSVSSTTLLYIIRVLWVLN